MLRLEHAHLLEEQGADRAALRRCEAALAGAQTREVDARATADMLTPSCMLRALRRTARQGLSALLRFLSGKWDFCRHSTCVNTTAVCSFLLHSSFLLRIGELRK